MFEVIWGLMFSSCICTYFNGIGAELRALVHEYTNMFYNNKLQQRIKQAH